MLLRRDRGVNLERAWPRFDPNAYPVGNRNSSGFAHGHRGCPDHASFFYTRSSHPNPGSYTHPIRSSKPNPFLYSDTYRHANGHANSYHNVDAKFDSHCYVNFDADDDTLSDARSTYIHVATSHSHAHTCSTEPHACSAKLHTNGHCHDNFDGHRDSHSDPD